MDIHNTHILTFINTCIRFLSLLAKKIHVYKSMNILEESRDSQSQHRRLTIDETSSTTKNIASIKLF